MTAQSATYRIRTLSPLRVTGSFGGLSPWAALRKYKQREIRPRRAKQRQDRNPKCEIPVSPTRSVRQLLRECKLFDAPLISQCYLFGRQGH